MKRRLFFSLSLLLLCTTTFAQVPFIGAFLRSVLFNSNVYKTKQNLTVTRVYDLSTGTVLNSPVTYTLVVTSGDFVRYRVLKEDDKPFIKILPGMEFSGNNVVFSTGAAPAGPPPENYVFQLSDEPSPAQKYLASSRITGMPIVMPVKYRLQGKDNSLSADFTIGYSFGYKIKCGNNPYRERYVNIIPFAVGLGKDTYVPKDSIDVKGFKGEEALIASGAMGLTYEFNSANIGVFWGRDYMFNSKTDWYYQNKSWLSLGFGYKIGKD